MIKTLPSMEHTFTINVKGSETAQVFEGTFTYKIPNIRARSEIAKTAARLNEDLKNLDEDTKFLHTVLSTLKHTLLKSPEWWAKADFGFELFDLNVIFEVYKACSDFYDKWAKEVYMGETTAEKK